MQNNKNSKILIILFTADFYKYYYALNLASTYKATNKDVSIFYTGYAINFLSKYWKKYDRKKINNRLIKKKMPGYIEILGLCADLKVNFYFCNTALDFLNSSDTNFLHNINIKSTPLYKILNKYKNEQTIFI